MYTGRDSLCLAISLNPCIVSQLCSPFEDLFINHIKSKVLIRLKFCFEKEIVNRLAYMIICRRD